MTRRPRIVRLPRFPRRLRWGLAAIAALGIVVASVTDVGGRASGGALTDKHLHVLAYATFSLVLAYATLHYRTRTLQRALVVVGGAMVLGISVELLQAPLVYRTFSVADLLANGIGALAGLAWLAVESRIRYVAPSAIVDE